MSDTTTAAQGARSAGPPARRGPDRPSSKVRRDLLAALAVGALLIAGLVRFTSAGGAAPVPAPAAAPVATTSVAALTRAQDAVRARPDDPAALTQLGLASLTRARETADPAFYARAAEALERARALRPDDVATLVGLGLVDLARHDFTRALELGTRATAIEPAAADALAVQVDALIELGRYDEAVVAAQRMVDQRPALASLARVSYLRELNGDRAGAITTLTSAITAGSRSPADRAYVGVLLGDLQLADGRLAEAQAAYDGAQRDLPGYPAATVGLARLDIARGSPSAAADRLADATARLPLPEPLALHGDVLTALGRPAEAQAAYDAVRATAALERAAGISVDLETARFEADHARDPGGRPAEAVALARSAAAARPTIYGSDVLGWALRQAGAPTEALPHARAAVRLGTQDPVLWWHLAAVEADLGSLPAARAALTRALASPTALPLRDRPAVTALAATLGLPAPPW